MSPRFVVYIFPCTRLGYGICSVYAPSGRRSYAICVLFLFQKTSIFQFSSGTLLRRSPAAEVPSFSPSYILLLPVLYWCVYISSITLCTCGVFSFESSAMLCFRLVVYYVIKLSGKREIACPTNTLEDNSDMSVTGIEYYINQNPPKSAMLCSSSGGLLRIQSVQ